MSKTLPKRYTGREAGGPACIGCVAYRPTGTLRSICVERGRMVLAAYRGACGLYEFHTIRPKGTSA